MKPRTMWLALGAVVLIALVGGATAFYVAVGMPPASSKTFVVSSENMWRTLLPGERVICNTEQELQAGSIVVFSLPGAKAQFMISRVVATGGQSVDVVDGALTVDGQKLAEPYLDDSPTDAGTVQLPVDVPAGYVWVMGDNRPNSGDSRFFGPVPASTVLGAVTHVYWPPKDIRRPD